MRKVMIGMLSVAMSFALIACGSVDKVENERPENADTVYESVDELAEAGDFALLRPDGLEITDEIACSLITDPQIYEYSFISDNVRCVVRFSKADKDVDISRDSSDEDGVFSDSDAGADSYYENGEMKALRWFTADGQYVFMAYDNGSWDSEKFETVCRQLEEMEPVNWDSEVAFKDYKAIEGSYQTKDKKSYAWIALEGDHAAVTIEDRESDQVKYTYEADAYLQGDQLVCEKMTGLKTVYNEKTKKNKETKLKDKKGESIEIKDGKLTYKGKVYYFADM